MSAAWLEAVANGCLVETTGQTVSQWVAENVWLAPPMCPPSLAGPYDLGKTPYVARFMDLARDADVRKVVVMKSSRTGFTEAFLNILRWMPTNAPGPVLYAINSQDKARDVARKRVIPSLREVAGEQLTGKDDDVTLHRVQLVNMDITITGSGSAGPFMETWYQLIGLDELEEHDDAHQETTVDRSEGRLVGVENGKLYLWSKPQLAGGPIHREYLRGTQEKWWVPCPRCGEFQELVWEFVRFDHCRDLVGWDLDRVREETWYQCRSCGGRIEETEKRAMVGGGEWRPDPDEKRRGVRPEPGVVSMQVNDLISFHQEVMWGELAAKFLSAFKINPDHQKQKFWWTNHLGLPWEERSATMHTADLEKLKGGAVEVADDGTRIVIGKEFRWAWRYGERQGPLPIVPRVVTLCSDKQGDRLKWVVFAWADDWQAWVIEYGVSAAEWELLGMLEDREYQDPEGKSHRIFGGLIDARFKPREVFAACAASSGRMYPAMGLVESAELRGRSIKTRSDQVDGVPVLIYDFHNHTFESGFYLNTVKRRADPRLWLPVDMGDEFGRELCSARLVVKRGVGGRMIQKWDRDPDVPNDWGDACKLQYVCREVLLANGW